MSPVHSLVRCEGGFGLSAAVSGLAFPFFFYFVQNTQDLSGDPPEMVFAHPAILDKLAHPASGRFPGTNSFEVRGRIVYGREMPVWRDVAIDAQPAATPWAEVKLGEQERLLNHAASDNWERVSG